MNIAMVQPLTPDGRVDLQDMTLFFRTARLDPVSPDWPERDRIVLSKAHASPGLYAAMALRGFFQVDDLDGARTYGRVATQEAAS